MRILGKVTGGSFFVLHIKLKFFVYLTLIFLVLLTLAKFNDIKNFFAMLQYPIKYQEFVEKYSSEYNVDKYLIYSIIKVESKFNPNATSKVGAKGLMQIMDSTAKECNEKLNCSYDIPNDIYDPEINIRFGTFYMKNLIKSYGDISLAITAYNGGTGNVKKWLNDGQLSDGQGGLSQIPFEETEDYVKRVLKVYGKYKDVYEE